MAEVRAATAPGGIWPIGHALTLLRDPLAFLTTLADSDHGLVQIRIGPGAAVIVCDPGLTDRVLRDDRTFDKGGPLFDIARKVVGNNVITCPHSMHRQQRRMIQPTFGRSRYAAYGQAMTAQIDAVTGSWRDGQVVDMVAETMRLTARTVMATMFSGNLAPALLERALDDVTTIVNGLYWQMVSPPPLNRLRTPSNRRYQRAQASLRRLMADIVVERRLDDVDRGDLLSAMLSSRDTAPTPTNGTANSGMNDSQICDQLMTFFIAGSETTASALAWALHLLAAHSDIQQRVQQEVDDVLRGDPASYANLPDLTLTKHVVTESLRLYPPGWLFSRTVTTDTRLGEYHLPAGTAVLYSPYLIHRRSDLYPNPDRFDPDRWDGRQPPIRKEAFLAFGAGARRCAGDTFGITELSLAVATIASRWRLHHLTGNRVRPAVAMALHPRKLKIRVEARHNSTSPAAGGPR